MKMLTAPSWPDGTVQSTRDRLLPTQSLHFLVKKNPATHDGINPLTKGNSNLQTDTNYRLSTCQQLLEHYLRLPVSHPPIHRRTSARPRSAFFDWELYSRP